MHASSRRDCPAAAVLLHRAHGDTGGLMLNLEARCASELGESVEHGRGRLGAERLGGRHVRLQLLQVALQLGATVLEPRDHLRQPPSQRRYSYVHQHRVAR